MTHSRNYHLWHLVMSDISLSTDMKKVAGYYQLLRRMAVYFSGSLVTPQVNVVCSTWSLSEVWPLQV